MKDRINIIQILKLVLKMKVPHVTNFMFMLNVSHYKLLIILQGSIFAEHKDILHIFFLQHPTVIKLSFINVMKLCELPV